MKFLYGIFLRRNIRTAKFVHGKNCYGEISFRRSFITATYLQDKVSLRRIFSRRYSHVENSYSEISGHACILLSADRVSHGALVGTVKSEGTPRGIDDNLGAPRSR